MDRRHAIVLILSAAVLGLAIRLVGFGSSLWLDEFGTLWVVEGSLATAWERALAFHGQSPLYYLFTWLGVQVCGESEWALRLPALVCGLLSVPLMFLLGREVGGPRCGALTALLAWFAPYLLAASVDARPYALANLCAALLLLGFLRAARSGAARDRFVFVAGGVGLFYSHYVLALLAGGVGLAYVITRELRAPYSGKRFAVDVGIQAGLAIPGLFQLAALRARRGDLHWLAEPDLTVPFGVLGSLLALAAAGWLLGERESLRGPATRVLLLSVLVPVGALYLLALLGTNLLAPRYLVVTCVPAAVLAAQGLLALRPGRAALFAAAWFLMTFGVYMTDYVAHGVFCKELGKERWREAVELLEARLRDEPHPTPVLYRSGFVEEDTRPRGGTVPAARAPLRSPGLAAPYWRLVPLTYLWEAPGREEYFARVVAPPLQNASAFYLLSCDNGYATYPRDLLAWAERTTGQRWVIETLEAGRGITLLRCSRP